MSLLVCWMRADPLGNDEHLVDARGDLFHARDVVIAALVACYENANEQTTTELRTRLIITKLVTMVCANRRRQWSRGAHCRAIRTACHPCSARHMWPLASRPISSSESVANNNNNNNNKNKQH